MYRDRSHRALAHRKGNLIETLDDIADGKDPVYGGLLMVIEDDTSRSAARRDR